MKTQPQTTGRPPQADRKTTEQVHRRNVRVSDTGVMPGERNQEYIPLLPQRALQLPGPGLRFGPREIW